MDEMFPMLGKVHHVPVYSNMKDFFFLEVGGNPVPEHEVWLGILKLDTISQGVDL
jgi:hypothetical protein